MLDFDRLLLSAGMLLVLGLAPLGAACGSSGDDCTPGTLGCRCGSDALCGPSAMCLSGVCVGSMLGASEGGVRGDEGGVRDGGDEGGAPDAGRDGGSPPRDGGPSCTGDCDAGPDAAAPPCADGPTASCEGAVMRLCDPAHGEETRECDSEALCRAGLAARRCAVCIPETSGCSDSMLSVCNADGRGYTLTECTQPSNACREAVCDDGACQDRDRPARTACSSGAGSHCDGAGACVECIDATHCNAGANEICDNHACVVAPFCGDGAVNGSEGCDPTAAGYSAFNCSALCQPVTNYTACTDAGDCLGGTVCAPTHACGLPCEGVSDCAVVPGFPNLDIQCPAPLGTTCIVRCTQTADCPPGTTCNGGGTCAGP